MSDNTLNISENFYSIQGEGVTTGVPSYFIRLKGCNLSCGLTPEDLKQLKPRDIVPNGTLHKEGKATWTCDSASVWMFGKKTPYQDIVDDWKKLGIYEWILSGRCHIIWTGGEPTIKAHQESIVNFFKWMQNNTMFGSSYHEIETNGTNVLSPWFDKIIDQVNCSVKLTNSGMPREKRINSKALQSITKHKNYWFKFVISKEDDIKEIENDFIIPFSINPKKVILMPGLDDQKNFHERTNFVLETAKKYGYIGLSRMHISAWGSCVGV